MVNVADNLVLLGVDQKRLAKKTGLLPKRISEIFSGAPPTARELRIIADYLRLPADALLRVQTSLGQSDLRYRKTPRRKPPLAAEARTQEVAAFLLRNNVLPRPEVDRLRVDAQLDDRRTIERAAEHIRARICKSGERLDPLPDLIDRMDKAGLASCVVLHDLGVEGASTSLAGAGLIIAAARSFAPRMLFTCAHELSHVVLGHTDSGKWLIDENTIEAFDADNAEERLCNTLAAALLQPAQGVVRLLEAARRQFEIPEDALTATEVLLVARYFGTSFFVAATRLEQLDIAPAGTAVSFERAIKTEHKSLETYAEGLGLPPRTRVHIPLFSHTVRNRIAERIEQGQISIGRAADVFGYSVTEISNALA